MVNLFNFTICNSQGLNKCLGAAFINWFPAKLLHNMSVRGCGVPSITPQAGFSTCSFVVCFQKNEWMNAW